MNTCAKISTAQRVAALKALGIYSPLGKALGKKPCDIRYCLDGEYQYAYCSAAVFRWRVDSFTFPVGYFNVSPLSDSALSSVKALFARYDNESGQDFPMAIGEFKRSCAAGPLKECSPSEAFSLANKRLNPRLLSRVLYTICSHENCIPVFRSYGNAAQPIYFCGDLGEAALCPLRPYEQGKET